MLLNFVEALGRLGRDAGFRIANEVQPESSYVFTQLLPETTLPTYDVKAANMTVRATMAGLVGMDSAYPPGGVVSSSTFMAESAKLANEVYLPEETIRHLQTVVQQLALNSAPTVDYVANEALNFLNKAVIQPHRDVMEWLRGQALAYGAIDWTFNQKNLLVDYGIPTANKLTERTTGNSDAYGHSTSKFWVDMREARRVLRYNVRGFWLNSTTLDEIVNNAANSIEITSQDNSRIEFRRLTTIGGNTMQSSDARDRVTFFIYDGEGEILDPADYSKTKIVKYLPDGKIIAVGNNVRSGYRVGEGSTPDPLADRALGYTHIAPTVEAGGRPGRWAELYTPQDKPYQLNGRGVTNGLPVIEAPHKIVIMTTEIA